MLQIDEQSAIIVLPFRTCLPVGCVAPIALDETSVEALRDGTTLSLTARSSDTEQDLNSTISLSGLSSGLDKVKALMAS